MRRASIARKNSSKSPLNAPRREGEYLDLGDLLGREPLRKEVTVLLEGDLKEVVATLVPEPLHPGGAGKEEGGDELVLGESRRIGAHVGSRLRELKLRSSGVQRCNLPDASGGRKLGNFPPFCPPSASTRWGRWE